MAICMFQCYSVNSSHPLLPLPFPQVCSLCLHLYSCSTNRFIITIFLDSIYIWLYAFSSITQSCQILCNSMDCSTPSFPVHHRLPELTQTHVQRVTDAIRTSYHLSSASPPAINLFQSQFFTSGGQSIGVSASASVFPMNIQD